MNIERRLTEKIGPAGGMLHTARSRNDQVALDMRLFLREEVRLVIDALNALQRELARAGQTAHRCDHAWIYALAAGAAGPVRASFACLLRYVRPRPPALR